ncbi:MAG: fibronectin type III domain-containing protein [Sphingobacteriaceae bacterium]|nr:fibronectin type III domain-containing protein [Sphingobacteriaceae bacterium]
MNFYKRFLSVILTVLGCFAAGSSNAQQVYPVQANLRLTPPYSLYLSDYTAPGAQKLQLDLFLKDLTKNNYPFRLRVRIEGFGITISSKPDFSVTPLYLNSGEMRVIYGDELSIYLDPANLVFQGLDLNSFQAAGGKLPEGVYRITFEVQDFYNKKVVSNAGTTVLAAYLSYPPIINMPFNNTIVTALNPQNVLFQWTPRHTGSINAAYNVAYKFSLVELNPPNRDPNDAINTSVPLFQTFTDQTFLAYGAAEPQLTKGNNYAVRVQAVEATGRDIFVNNGYSEVVKFTYGTPCETPNYVFAEVAGSNSIKVSWGQLPNQVSFAIRYREANNASAAWFEQVTNETSYIISGLRSGRVYEYQVKAECSGLYGDYTPVQTFQVPDESMLQGDLVCGQTQSTSTLANDALNILTPGMFFMAGSFPVTVTEVSGGNGVFSGTGTIGIPLLNKLNFLVTFSSISINADLKLINGKVSVARQTLEQSQDQLVADLTITPDATGHATAIVKDNLPNIINVTIPSPTVLPVYVPASNTITFEAIIEDGNDETNTPQTITIQLQEGQPPYVFQDKNGQTYEVAKDGTVTNRGKINASELTAGSTLTAKAISTEKGKVIFSAPGQKYGFDTFNSTLKGNAKYNVHYTLANDGTADNRISWKSVEAGKGDQLVARLEKTDQSLDPNKLEFRNGRGEPVDFKHDLGSLTYTINIVGAPGGTEREIYAFYLTGSAKDAGINLGKVNVSSFNPIAKKVVIVPVNGAGAGLSASSIQASLNEIYQQAVVSWDVRVADDFSDITLSSDNDGLDVGNSNELSAYTGEQKALTLSYKAGHSLENGTYYIFIVDRFSDAAQDGYMVRGGQVGFVKAGSGVSRAIAHELGHGAFSLSHTWEEIGGAKGATANLMDYDGGTELWYSQWKYLRNPDVIFRPFLSDDEGAVISQSYFLDPSGKPFRLKSRDGQGLYDKIIEPKTRTQPNGCLLGFRVNDIEYEASFSGNVFTGYHPKLGGAKYQNAYDITKETVKKVRVIHNFGDCTVAYLDVPYTAISNTTNTVVTVAYKLPLNPVHLPIAGCADGKGTVPFKVEEVTPITDYYDYLSKLGAYSGAGYRQDDTPVNGSKTHVYNYTRCFTDAEMAALLKTFQAVGSATATVGKLFVTDVGTPQAKKDEIRDYINGLNGKTVAIWVNYNEQKIADIVEVKFGSGIPGATSEASNAFIAGCKNILKAADWAPAFNPFAAIFDGLAGLISELKVPERFYDPDYNQGGLVYNEVPARIYGLASGISLSEELSRLVTGTTEKYSASRVSFAMFCGVSNGVVDMVKGVTESASIASKAPGFVYDMITNAAERAKMKAMLDKISFSQIQQLAGNAITQCSTNPCMKAYCTSYGVLNVATIVIPFTSVGKVGAVAGALKTLDALDAVGAGMSVMFKACGTIIKPTYRLAATAVKTGGKALSFTLEVGQAFIKPGIKVSFPSGVAYSCIIPLPIRIDLTQNVKNAYNKIKELSETELKSKIEQALAGKNVDDLPVDADGNTIVEVPIEVDGETVSVPVVAGTDEGLEKVGGKLEKALAARLADFLALSPAEKIEDIARAWRIYYPEIFFERRVFEEMMGHYRYKLSTGWSHTSAISLNFKGVDFYKGSAQGSNIFAETAVSMKTTLTTNVDNWLSSEAIQKNIEFIRQGLSATGMPDPSLLNNGRMFINQAEIHIYMPKANITESLKSAWIEKLNAEVTRLELAPNQLKFEIKALEDFIE